MNGVSTISNQVQQLAQANQQLLQQANQRFETQRQKTAEISEKLTSLAIASTQRAAEVNRIGMLIDTRA